MKSARELAMQAAYEADAPLREIERKRQRLNEEREERIRQETAAMVTKAVKKIESVLFIDATDWEIVEAHPTWAVLRDSNDKPGLLVNDKLTLMVTAWYAERGELRVYYAPYAGYAGRTHNGDSRFGTTSRWGGPEITDLLSLGRALKEHEANVIAYHRSMPAHLP